MERTATARQVYELLAIASTTCQRMMPRTRCKTPGLGSLCQWGQGPLTSCGCIDGLSGRMETIPAQTGLGQIQRSCQAVYH